MSEVIATKRMYDEDAYATEFEAEVVSCNEMEQDGNVLYQVILNQTLFFPEEGGQSPDKGVLEDIEVVDVQIEKGVILHTLGKPLPVGNIVHGKIDWNHRFSNMQQHSGEHIFSGIVHARYGYNNVGFHLSDQIVTMDFDGVLTEAQVEQIEYAVNEAIAKNVIVTAVYPSKEELSTIAYRSKIEIEGPVRIVTVTGYDVCACCAPHVHRTGEIGILKVMSLSNYKGGVRISMLCGFRALKAFGEKSRIIGELMGLLTCGQEMLPDNVSKQKATNQSLKSQLVAAKQALMEYKLKEIPVEQEHVVLFEKELDQNAMRNAVNHLTEAHRGLCAFWSGEDKEGYNFIIGSKNIDCKMVATALREKLQARGGGSNVMIQGSVCATREQIEKTLSEIV